MINDYLENCCDEAIRFDGCDDAIIGHDNRNYLVYSYAKLIKVFMSQGMTDEEAVEWIDYNVVGIMPQNYTIYYENS